VVNPALNQKILTIRKGFGAGPDLGGVAECVMVTQICRRAQVNELIDYVAKRKESLLRPALVRRRISPASCSGLSLNLDMGTASMAGRPALQSVIADIAIALRHFRRRAAGQSRILARARRHEL